MPSRKSHAMACLGPHDEGEKYLEKSHSFFLCFSFFLPWHDDGRFFTTERQHSVEVVGS